MERDSEPPLSALNSRHESMQVEPSNNEQTITETFERLSLGTAAATPLPESSPAGSPKQTPKAVRNGVLSSDRPPLSPARAISISSPLNPERRSSTPLLHAKRSTSSLSMRNGISARPPLGRKASSGRLPSTSSMIQKLSLSSADLEEEQTPTVTAASIAQDHFKKELEVHSSGNLPAETLAIIHDSCYGHRYSRPRTSKGTLSTIVERPERLHASILGLSTAYVRLGGRHVEGCIPLRPELDVKLIPPPPFHIKKSSRSMPLSSPAVTQVHGQRWMEELQLMCESAEEKLATNGKELARPATYGRESDGSPSPQLHEGDLYLCKDSLNALEGCLGGVCEGVDSVLGAGPAKRAFVCIRPPGHHCSATYPSGFCWLNNVHVGIQHAAMTHGLTHAAIIDFDLHHGDGSQSVAWNHNRKATTLPKFAAYHRKIPIGYYSLHDINSYPCEMGDEDKVRNASLCIENAHGQSIWNVHLEEWKNLPEFWRLYQSRYLVLLEKARRFLMSHTQKLKELHNGPRPKAAIFVSAGFDASEWEGSGMQRHKVNVPTSFYAKFTTDIISLAEEDELGVEGRVISVLEGGYSDRALTSGVLGHMCGLTCGSDLISRASSDMPVNRLAADLVSDGSLSSTGNEEHVASTLYDTEWWAETHLEALESMSHPRPASVAAKKSKDKAPGNYSSPTQASTAKMVDPSKARRYSSLSSLDMAHLSAEPESPQPLPDVDWVTASYELSRLLIPTKRQTLSCKHEELNAETNRVKRERQSIMPQVPAIGEGRMQLRERRPRPAAPAEEPSKALSRANRRRTIAALGALPESDFQAPIDHSGERNSVNARPSSRRLSAASSVLSGLSSLTLEDDHGPGKENAAKKISMERSSRAPSVLSEGAPKPPMIKKTRTPALPKPPTSKPSTGKSTPKRSAGEATTLIRSPTRPAPEANKKPIGEGIHDSQMSEVPNAGSQKSNGIASSSPGMKKMSIKLTVPSPEENAAREKKAAEDRQKKNISEKPKKPRAPKKPAAPKATKPAAAKAEKEKDQQVLSYGPQEILSENNVSTQCAPPEIHTPSQNAPTMTATVDREANRKEYIPQNSDATPANAPFSGPLTALASATDVNPPEDIFSNNSSAGVTQALAVEQNSPQFESANSVPPFTETEWPKGNPTAPPLLATKSPPNSAKKSRIDLPVFTSTSPIPFAQPSVSRTSGPSSIETSAGGHTSIIEEPMFSAGVGKEDAANLANPTADRPSSEYRLDNKTPAEELRAGASIWEVPETPRR